jgi:hypothetical protein
MAPAARTFRIFVSSPFADFVEERRVLHDQVFPALKRLCDERGARFQPVDLRWGVSEEAARQQRTVDICLAEIERCRRTTRRPNFILLLGDRYGWRPLPPRLPADLFDFICRTLPGIGQRRLRRWYRLDTNAVPPERVLQPRRGGNRSDATWAKIEADLRSDILSGLSKLEVDNASRRRYSASATELEVMRGVLDAPDAPNSAFCFFRTISGLPDSPSASEFVDVQADGTRDLAAAQALQELKQELRSRLPGRVYDYYAGWTGDAITLDHVTSLCRDVRTHIGSAILDELENLEASNSLDVEIDAHAAFGSERARDFTGRQTTLSAIEQYLAEGGRQPLILTGPSGSGKTALIAKAAAISKASNPRREIVARFIGATPGSSNDRILASDLVRDLARRYGASEPDQQIDACDLGKSIDLHIKLATAERPAVLFVDGL